VIRLGVRDRGLQDLLEHSRGFARREVHWRQAVAAVERITSAAASFGGERKGRGSQGIEIAIDSAHGDSEALSEHLCRHPGAPAAQIFGQREEAFGALHLNLPRSILASA